VAQHFQWDNVVALGYAAEQLFVAGQLLTSDTVPLDRAVRVACERHISSLLAYKNLLPAELVKRVESCCQKYRQLSRGASIERRDAEDLSRTVLGVLDDVRRVLNEVAEHEDRQRLLYAA
jgi:hypothetical protein